MQKEGRETMPETQYLLLIVGMGLVTYIPRYLPLFFLAYRALPRWLIEWLDMIPVAILSALVFSELFISGSPRHLDLLQAKSLVAIPTVLVALRTRSLGWTVIFGMILFWLAERIF
jgi:branched-subunit amino acid transport protein